MVLEPDDPVADALGRLGAAALIVLRSLRNAAALAAVRVTIRRRYRFRATIAVISASS